MMNEKPVAATFSSSRGLSGRTTVPGDKSISHRALLLGAVSEGETVITNLLRSEDTEATLRAVRSLGVAVREMQDGSIRVADSGWEALCEPQEVIDVGNSGTLLRILPGIVASLPFVTMLTGDASIRRRPVDRILLPLRRMGATAVARAQDRLPPLLVRGGHLHGIDLQLEVASAQVKSCLLLAGARAEGETSILEPRQSRDHTERMLRAAGVDIAAEEGKNGGSLLRLTGRGTVALPEVKIPGDFSSSAFLMVAALLIPGSEVVVEEVGLNPTRTALLEVLKAMDADIEVKESPEGEFEPHGALVARSSHLKATDIGGPDVASLIDELPIWSLAAARADGVSRLRGASELRVKESDRLRGIADLLRNLGVHVLEVEDGLDIHGKPEGWISGHVSSLGDHRLAMVGAVAGYAAKEGVSVDDISCADVSFPGFVDTITQLAR